MQQADQGTQTLVYLDREHATAVRIKITYTHYAIFMHIAPVGTQQIQSNPRSAVYLAENIYAMNM